MPLAVKQILQNRYRVVSLLTSGGMGAIYDAWDTRLSMSVAVKEMVPQPGLDAHTLSLLRRQFQQEATILARLDHSHLVNVTDFFEEQGNAYLVMRLIKGENLAERIKQQGPLPEEQILIWTHQLLDALIYCHSQGVLHRDIKPQNVIIRPDGRATLVDFGLVKLWDPNSPQTQTAVRGIGTPEYAPPEQYDTSGTGHTDPRTDVYSLGATLYHTLIGQAPPTATQRVVNPELMTPIQPARAQISPRMNVVLAKAMELRPDNRFQSMTEMQAALRSSAPIPPPPRQLTGTRVMGQQPPAAKRKRIGITILAAILIVACLAVAALGGNWLFGRLQSTPPVASQATATSTGEPEPQTVSTATTAPPTPTSTEAPRPTLTPPPTFTPTPAAAAVVLADGADLRPGADTWWRVSETLPAGTELELIGYDPDLADWVYVHTIDESSSGWAQIADLEINRELADLDLVTPVPIPTSAPPTLAPTCATGPLELDTWFVGTICHSGGNSWSATVFAEGRGGNCTYTYSWEGIVQAGPMPGATTFQVAGSGAIVGRVSVTSGGQTISEELYISAPDCD